MKIAVGSRVFFNKYKDFVPHDNDYVLFETNPSLYKTFASIRGKGSDVFAYKKMDKEEFLNYERGHIEKLPMAAGKLLVPELCKYMGITLNDLKEFETAFSNMDEKHFYEKIIYDAYMENGDFILTDKQRDKAYQLYKEARKETTN